ncbi:MAG: FAD-binding domain-containing protein [Francisella endosymbiont of Hyalomma asiaticum]
MRALIATGWLNFRMRAMLMSFASYHLWLDWHKTSLYLARLFTSY